MRRLQAIVVTSFILFTETARAVNFEQCLAAINNITIDGKTDNHGRLLPPSTSNATAITYGLCVSQCGAGQEPFQWSAFSQQFSSWLLPWLALVSQLPFGANDNLDNLESMLLSVGSPTLAAYSLALTALNGRWIAQLFSSYTYPNVQNAVRILSSLQQSPLRINTDDARLDSLVVLRENDEWWSELVVWLDYTHTWSISAAISIAWVIIAYLLTVADNFSQSFQTTLVINANGQGVGSLWTWLLPIVIGWLQLSPKCDSIRLSKAVERANSLAYVATPYSPPCKASEVSGERAISLKLSNDDAARLDESSTPPIYNYSRFLPWVRAVMVVSDTFSNVSELDHRQIPVVPGTKWQYRNFEDIRRLTRRSHVENYCLPRRRRRWGLDESAATRMFLASAFALILQWGTTISAVVTVWFTPTVGLGCRSASYIIYGMLSTSVWVMLLASSILTYYSTNAPEGYDGIALRYSIARLLSIVFRRVGKLVAALNAVLIVATGILQFSSFYDRCYCDSSVLWLGKSAYNVIVLHQSDIGSMRIAWISGLAVAALTASIFASAVSLLVNPSLPP